MARDESEGESAEKRRVCSICGGEPTRVIFSTLGHWLLCGEVVCYKELTGRYEDSKTEVTWMQRPLRK